MIAKEKERMLRVTEKHPFINLRELQSTFPKKNAVFNTVEALTKSTLKPIESDESILNSSIRERQA